MGSLLGTSFTDLDGGQQEVVCKKPDVPDEQGILHAEWATFTIDGPASTMT